MTAGPGSTAEPRTLLARAGAPGTAFAVPVTNATATRLHLHRVAVAPVELRSERATVAGQVRLRGILRPGASGACRVRLDLPPGTPPGDYAGEIEVLGERRPVRVLVPPARELQVRPRRLVCDVAREGHHVVELALENRGNVPVTVQHPIAVRAEPRDRSCRVLRGALARSVASDPPGPILDALVRAAADSTDADPILAAQVEGAPFDLAPGEARFVRLTLRIPAGERGAYRAILDVAGTRVRIDLQLRQENGGER